ncbi:MAG: hypothetical protein QOH93_458 [Chloroflexia bacterium]|nr:hypothetical protein [Chloroflexia bacterium]
MQTINASIAWAGPNIDAFTLFVEPTPAMWAAEPVKPGQSNIYIYQALDSNRQRSGQLAGVHITGFLNFDAWGDLPDIPLLWRLPGREPEPLGELLRSEQQRVRQEAEQNAVVRTGTGCV